MGTDKRQLIGFVIAIVIGLTLTGGLWSEISPAADLKLSLVGIDTDLGPIDSSRVGGLAETTSWTGTQIWIDPDVKGDTTFTLQTGGLARLVFSETSVDIPNAKSGKPDIIATITEPVPIIHPDSVILSLKTDKTEFDYQGQHYELLKTTFEVMLKTMGDSYADSLYAEIAQRTQERALLSEIIITPPVGDVWKGNVYLQYTIQNHPGAFIYEVYINKKPKVGRITVDELDTTLSLQASAIPAVALASYEQYSAVAFFDSFNGRELQDVGTVLTNTGVMALGGTLGVGADPIIEEHTVLADEFKGWNMYDVAIQYQIAVIIALPVVVENGESTGELINPDTGLPTGDTIEDILGSQREGEQGDASYYRTEVEDTEAFLTKVLDDLNLGDMNTTLQLFLTAVIVVGVIIGLFYIITLFMPRRR